MIPGDREPQGAPSVADRLGAFVRSIGSDRDGISSRDTVRLFPRVISALRGAGRSVAHAVPADRAGQVIRDLAPRLPIRTAETLRAQNPGRSTEEIADALVRGAAAATATAGVAGGSLMFVSKKGPWLAAAIPVRLAAESVLVASIEIKLVAELHEIYGRPIEGPLSRRGMVALRLWADHRGIDTNSSGLVGALTHIVRVPASRTAAAGATRTLFGLKGAAFTGGFAGGTENRRVTIALAEQIRKELRRYTLG